MAAASAWFNRQPIVCKTTALSVCSVADSFIASSLPYPAPQGEPPCRRIARAALPVAPAAPVKGTTVPPGVPDSATALPHRCRHTSAARGAPRPSKGEEANHAQKGTPVPLGFRSDAEEINEPESPPGRFPDCTGISSLMSSHNAFHRDAVKHVPPLPGKRRLPASSHPKTGG